MAGNSFGQLFRYTSFGESHGPGIGCVVDGTPPRIPLSEAHIQTYLDRRRPGGSRFVSQRRETDRVEILSGTFDGMTTGAPIALLIRNADQRSGDYDDIKEKFRPGHADFTYQAKYGIRDYRGGGRSSARETAVRVAAGAIARLVLGREVQIRGAVTRIGPHAVDQTNWDWDEVAGSPLWCPDAKMAGVWEDYLDDVRKKGSSIGAVVQVSATGVPAGLGAPVCDKMDADLAKALMSINAVKGVEIGAGFAAAQLTGEENADEMRNENGQVRFLSNHAGGILGGITTGQEIVARIALKPTSSILTPRRTVDEKGQDTEIVTKGRHDPCVGIRAVPVAEAMVAVTLADHFLRHKAQCA